jgi:hypothetical protein
MTSFPGSWPADCPPADALAASGVVFRIIKSGPPSADDFLSYRELGKLDERRPCECVGLSVFFDLADAQHYADKYPYVGTLVAKAKLEAIHGRLKSTPRTFGKRTFSHATWWPFEGVERHSIFELCDE